MHDSSPAAWAADPDITVVRDALADGRDLIYFDDAGAAERPDRRPDQRALDPRPVTGELRWDTLSGEWVSVATSRQTRVHLPPADADPLAPQSPTNPSEIPDTYDVAVFENRSPSFGPHLGELVPAPDRGRGEHASQSFGRCEVVCFDPSSTGSLGTLSATRVRTIVEAWAHRTHELHALPGVAQVFPFENRGEAIGVTLHHPHGQIYAYPYVTPRTARTLKVMRTVGDDLFALLHERETNGPRVIACTAHWLAYVPYAARWPMELHVLPHRHVGRLDHTTLDERRDLAALVRRLVRTVDAVYDSPTPYMLGWHQAPVGHDEVRLMMTMTSPRRAADRLKFLASSESVMGAWVADIVPEAAAERLTAAYAEVGE